MEVLLSEYKPTRGRAEMGFTFVEAGKVVAHGGGFITKEYLERAINITRRRLAGLRPLKPNPKLMNESTYYVIERWNNKIYGKE